MKEIGISEFEQLVMERLTNPKDFVGRSLVLWNADFAEYSIVQRVIKQCCNRYNNDNPNNQVWFKLSDMQFDIDDYTQSETWHDWYEWNENAKEYNLRHELKRCGILLNTGCYMLYDQEDWLKFVNTHINRRGTVYQDCAVVVCVPQFMTQSDCYGNVFGPLDSKYIIKEEQFAENCDVYHIQPSIEEWARWSESFYDPEIIKVVRAYIEKNGVIWSFDYWLKIMDGLKELKENEGCSLYQITEDDVDLHVCGAVGRKHPAPDFCKFIYSFFANNPENE